MPTTNIELAPGYVLTITADAVSTGSVRRLPDDGGSTNYSATAISASSTTTEGPFLNARRYQIISDTGSLTYTQTKAELAEDSADLAAALYDETGAGAVVFSEEPTLERANVSGLTSNLTTVATGDSYTVPANSQCVIYDTFTVDGTVTVNGVLRTLDWPV